jgi:hypothetical protein
MTSPYSVLAYWGPRPASPAACAPKVWQMFDALAKIDPMLNRWFCADPDTGKPRLVSSLDVEGTARWIARGQNLSEIERKPMLEFGYRFVAMTELSWGPCRLVIDGKLGGYTTGNVLANYVCLSTPPLDPENEAVINFRVLKSVLLALASIWNPTWCRADPTDLLQLMSAGDPGHHRPRFNGGWMTYLSAPFAAKITPPPSAKCEQVDGGLLMAATDETFRVDNPAHVAVARDIDAALAPINALPWPPDANASGKLN